MDKTKNKSGFTLIEALIVAAVFGILWGVIGEFIVMIYRTQSYSTDQTLAVAEARHGLDLMIKEVRQARYAENGAYPLEKCGGKEFIFYGDIDGDGAVERVRYYLAITGSGTRTAECTAPAANNSCNVDFGGFLTGTLKSAQLAASTYGRYGTSSRFSELYADGNLLSGNICVAPGDNCTVCASPWTVNWQGLQTFNVTAAAADGAVRFTMDGSSGVTATCGPSGAKYPLKARFVFSWVEEIMNADNQLKRGVIEPTGSPAVYPLADEKITTVSSYVRNAPPVFTYYDAAGNEISEADSRILADTRSLKVNMIVDVNPQISPESYELRQMVRMRNLADN